MAETEIGLIREIGWHRARNSLYRRCYTLLKQLQDIVEQAVDDFLRQKGANPGRDVAVRLQQKLEELAHCRKEALEAWNDLLRDV